MISAVIFDMDGLLINSEPIWQQAEIEIFQKVNVPLTREMCMETMGLRIDEVVAHWHTRYPWETITKAALQEEIIHTVIKYIREQAEAMEGVFEILEFFRRKNLPMAIASSSHFRIIHAVIEKLGIEKYLRFVHSAENEEYGKPHPAIFIHTAKQMGAAPPDCLVFEDSFNGVLAARAARMKVVAVPDPSHFSQSRFDIAHLKLHTLTQFSEHHLDILGQVTT